MLSSNIIKAALSTYNWLGYLGNATDCTDLIAESSLKYPFVECLERNHVDNIHLEVGHPIFQRKRIDICIVPETNGIIKFSIGIPICVEFKFVHEDTDSKKERQRYFNDLLRLSYLKQYYKSAVCYFIVYGSSFLFNGKFRKTYKKPQQKTTDIVKTKSTYSCKSKYHDFLSFSSQNIKIVHLSNKKFTDYISVFNEEYLEQTSQNVDLSNIELRLATKLVYLYKSSSGNPYSMGIWEVTI